MTLHSIEGEMVGRRVDHLLDRHSTPNQEWVEPRIFDLSTDRDNIALEQSFAAEEIAGVRNSLATTANELFEVSHPDKTGDAAAREQFVGSIVSQGSAYGNWVLFPWSKELVRYPNKEEHRMLRTARNKNLVTEAEQAKLLDAHVAVFGLSVGRSVLEKLVLAGIGGTVIMGDPDRLSPTNLNRLSGSYADVGERKIDLVARHISEVDPYIEQVHFPDGFKQADAGKLAEARPDIIFDEVDNLQVKAQLRQFAKEQQIPLVMATDLGDRSIIDIERHDIEDTPLFNGRLRAADVEGILDGSLDPVRALKLTVKVAGMRYITPRLLESVMERGKTLSGFPQLGVTAAMGGSLASIAAREIILGRELPSGRYVCSPQNILGLKAQSTISERFDIMRRFLRSGK